MSHQRLDPPNEGGTDSAAVAKTSADPVDLYLAYLALIGMATSTAKRRRSSLRAFGRYLHPLPIERAGRDHVEQWLGRFPTPATRHAYRSDLSDFYQWATRRELVERNPVALTDPIKVPKRLPRPVPAHAVPGIIAAARCDTLRLALMLAAYAGLRRAEICSITGYDVQHHPEPIIAVRCGKGSKDRLVPMLPPLAAELVDARGGGRLVAWSPDHLGKLAAEHMRNLGWDCTLHQLRASYASEAARLLNGNVVAVGRLLGHESPDTTMRYIGWGGGETRERLGGLYAVA